MNFSGNIVDVVAGTIYPGTLDVRDGIIVDIVKETKCYDTCIIPGFIDSHVHIESSMLVPSEFARLAVTHGTVGAVCDPHEIANVLGIEGVRFMMENANTTPFKFYFGAPSCVPATPYETSGAQIGVMETEMLLRDDRILYLSEMMNFPGVIGNDSEVMAKIACAKRQNKPIDGHAPGLRGNALKQYAAAGISTDHECYEREEALEKISLGMKILIREGSAAKNFETLYPLIDEYPDSCMFCSDDKHPDDLVRGHINLLVKRAVSKGIDVMKVLKCASFNPVLHYKLDVGYLQKNQPADFIVVDNLTDFTVLKTVINGQPVAEKGKTRLMHRTPIVLNRFKAGKENPDDFRVDIKGTNIRVIGAIENQLITDSLIETPRTECRNAVSDTERDILKIAVVNRYEERPPAIGFIKNFGLQKGAIASSIAHDSHNIVAVGVDDHTICDAVNLIIEQRGGVSLVSDEFREVLALPVAGIMSDEDGFIVAEKYARLNALAKNLGTRLFAPYMTLSFMALLVIPHLKISDKGLFDSRSFTFTDLFVDEKVK
jgi:adenine deaminase